VGVVRGVFFLLVEVFFFVRKGGLFSLFLFGGGLIFFFFGFWGWGRHFFKERFFLGRGFSFLWEGLAFFRIVCGSPHWTFPLFLDGRSSKTVLLDRIECRRSFKSEWSFFSFLGPALIGT